MFCYLLAHVQDLKLHWLTPELEKGVNPQFLVLVTVLLLLLLMKQRSWKWLIKRPLTSIVLNDSNENDNEFE